ncbi:hypothetical protein DNX69_04360 [Rhodopseudomonas palustris]|uniref:Uncharacterized protein n=1 Tax=Rhodopseudomonas palustris TaxID=1076 RepID=A0A323UR13_RHOPL|nr:hypothetical protein DNX69_04360 [Rhodopseudomonas palustris]
MGDVALSHPQQELGAKPFLVIASEAKQSSFVQWPLDCFVAALLAMTAKVVLCLRKNLSSPAGPCRSNTARGARTC